MAKDLKLVLLFDLYGGLLSDRQRDIFDLYYNDDLSLAEIAENFGITRQGALDNIRRAENKLTDLEDKLHFAQKNRENTEIAAQAQEQCNRILAEYPGQIAAKELSALLGRLSF